MNGGRLSGRAALRALTTAALIGAAVVGLSTTVGASDRSADSRIGSLAGHGAGERAAAQSFGWLSGREDPPDSGPPITEPPVTEPPVTEPPQTEPPATEPPVTEPPATEPPVTVPELQTTVPASSVPVRSTPEAPSAVPAEQETSAPRTDPLPVTGSPTGLVLALAGLALIAGALAVRWTRRRADQLIGD